MNVFSRLFRKSTPTSSQTPSVAVRTQAPSVADAGLSIEIATMLDGDDLRAMAGLRTAQAPSSAAAGADTERAAQQRLALLVESGQIDFPQLCTYTGNGGALLRVAAYCGDRNHFARALNAMDDAPTLALLLVRDRSSHVRRAAAELMVDDEEIRLALPQVRTKDKSVYKILKAKSDARITENKIAAEQTQQAAAIAAVIDRHIGVDPGPLYAMTLSRLESQWRSLPFHPGAEMEHRVEQAIGRCRDNIATRAAQAELAESRLKEELAGQQAAREAAERAAQETQIEAAMHAESLRQQELEQQSLRAEQEQQLLGERTAVVETVRHVGGLIRIANAALNDGNTHRAAAVRRRIAERMLDAPTLPPFVARQLLHLDDKLQELAQWKDYAVAPKRLELIEEMETLIDSTEEPEILAEKIKSLRQDWRTIAQGIGDAAEEWDRFNRAAVAAYMPCQRHFEAQVLLRSANLENRKTLLQRLSDFAAATDMDNFDGRLCATVLREAPREWREHFQVDRALNRPLQQEFDALLDRLKARLDAWQEGHAAAKRLLIERVHGLLRSDDFRESVDTAKQLQVQWRDTGPAPRDQERSLWLEFRSGCDAVFQKRQKALDDHGSKLETNRTQAVVLCEELERIAAPTGLEESGNRVQLADLRDAFDAVGELPRGVERSLRDRFSRAVNRCQKQLDAMRDHNARAATANFFEAARRVHEYAWSMSMPGASTEDRETLRGEAAAFIAGVRQWPKGGRAAIDEALKRAPERGQLDDFAVEKALRALCIRCEILTETPSTPEDVDVRRAMQVERLVAGMGQGNSVSPRDWDDMLTEWLRLGAVAPESRTELAERFVRCWLRRPALSSP